MHDWYMIHLSMFPIYVIIITCLVWHNMQTHGLNETKQLMSIFPVNKIVCGLCYGHNMYIFRWFIDLTVLLEERIENRNDQNECKKNIVFIDL